ncbi:MAG: SRPBCC family protein [Acidimicrobiales bacterium]
MKHQIETNVDINSSPEIVWNILTDLESYPDWNPFVLSAEGNVAVGERLTNRLQNPGGKAMTIRPTVTAADPGETFEWLGRLGVPGVFDGRHRFELHPTATGTRLVHSESFNGVLVRFMRKMVDNSTLQGFEAMNAALKTRAESHVEDDS